MRAAIREALINSSVNDQSTKKVKCDFTFFFIFNGLSTIENGSTSLCCGNSGLIRVSLAIVKIFNDEMADYVVQRADSRIIRGAH